MATRISWKGEAVTTEPIQKGSSNENLVVKEKPRKSISTTAKPKSDPARETAAARRRRRSRIWSR